MKCPHCNTAIHIDFVETQIGFLRPKLSHETSLWTSLFGECANCHKAVIYLAQKHLTKNKAVAPEAFCHFRAYPQKHLRRVTPPEVPEEIAADYEEASEVLSISPKASAALSRRCLQAILRVQGYAQTNLAHQIDSVLNEADPKKSLSSSLHDTIDAIRNFGNFSAHPISDRSTLQIIDVEDGEAEWCLDILDEMFDHYYVRPAAAKARKDALNVKLAAGGKPPAK